MRFDKLNWGVSFAKIFNRSHFSAIESNFAKNGSKTVFTQTKHNDTGLTFSLIYNRKWTIFHGDLKHYIVSFNFDWGSIFVRVILLWECDHSFCRSQKTKYIWQWITSTMNNITKTQKIIKLLLAIKLVIEQPKKYMPIFWPWVRSASVKFFRQDNTFFLN